MKNTNTYYRAKQQLSCFSIAGVSALAGLVAPSPANAVGEGPFPSHDEGGIAVADIVAWANSVEDYSPSPQDNTNTNFANAIGPRGGGTVSLGDLPAEDIEAGVAPGEITLRFNTAITNGPGAYLSEGYVPERGFLIKRSFQAFSINTW